MLARELMYRRHAPLDLFQSLRIEFEAIEVLVQPGRRLVYLDRGFAE